MITPLLIETEKMGFEEVMESMKESLQVSLDEVCAMFDLTNEHEALTLLTLANIAAFFVQGKDNSPAKYRTKSCKGVFQHRKRFRRQR